MPKTLKLALLLIVIITACSKDQGQRDTTIPYIPINEKVNVNDPLYLNLQNIGGWVYYQAGSRGLILYRESSNSVKAYERQCTYDPASVCSTVDMNAVLLQAEDHDCCGSVFNISTGTILQGPAIKMLLEYNTQFDGTFVYITN